MFKYIVQIFGNCLSGFVEDNKTTQTMVECLGSFVENNNGVLAYVFSKTFSRVSAYARQESSCIESDYSNSSYAGIPNKIIAPVAMFVELGYGSGAFILVHYSKAIRAKAYFDAKKPMTKEYLCALLTQYNRDIDHDFKTTMHIMHN